MYVCMYVCIWQYVFPVCVCVCIHENRKVLWAKRVKTNFLKMFVCMHACIYVCMYTGPQMCEHGKFKSICKQCGGSQICSHGRRKSQVRDRDKA